MDKEESRGEVSTYGVVYLAELVKFTLRPQRGGECVCKTLVMGIDRKQGIAGVRRSFLHGCQGGEIRKRWSAAGYLEI